MTENELKMNYRKMYEREVKYLRWYKKLLDIGFEKEREYDDFSIFFGTVCELIKGCKVSSKSLTEVIKESEFLFGRNSDNLLEMIKK